MLVRFRIASVAALAVVLLTSAARAAESVTVDPPHTSATFTVAHLTITHVSGTIPLRDATLSIDASDVPTAVRVDFDLAKIATQNDERDADLRSDHWFDVAKTPDMSFVSTKIVGGAAGAFTLAGDLTMHGITKPVTLAGAFAGKVTDARGRTHLGYTATGTIDRTQWNVGHYPPAIVSNDVAVSIQLEAIAR